MGGLAGVRREVVAGASQRKGPGHGGSPRSLKDYSDGASVTLGDRPRLRAFWAF